MNNIMQAARHDIDSLIKITNSQHLWDTQPVFSFTSDIDWASEDVMSEYFEIVNDLYISPTLFVTHESEVIADNFAKGKIERGLHPNFMNASSHGDSFKEVAETCIKFAPEAFGFRSHRAFDLTDITHLMRNEYDFKYVSHQITVFQPGVRPILHESGLINFPVFFEDGTHLYNCLDLSFNKYRHLFEQPGIKVISFHPMNFIFNSPNLHYMRSIKDSLTRDQYNNISQNTINRLKHNGTGIKDMILSIVDFVKTSGYPIFSMNELYHKFMEAGQ